MVTLVRGAEVDSHYAVRVFLLLEGPTSLIQALVTSQNELEQWTCFHFHLASILVGGLHAMLVFLSRTGSLIGSLFLWLCSLPVSHFACKSHLPWRY